MKTKYRKHLAEKVADLEKAAEGLLNMYADLIDKYTALENRLAALEEIKHKEETVRDEQMFRDWTYGDDE